MKTNDENYVHITDNGEKWYLVYREMTIKALGKTQKIYFFVTEQSFFDTSNPKSGCALPDDKEVFISTEDGLPGIRNK